MEARKFVTAICCIDGRIQEPVKDWLIATYKADFVDTITEPGVEKVLADDLSYGEFIKEKVMISVNFHQSKVIAVVGHYDCAANPVGRDVHIAQIKKAIGYMGTWGLPQDVELIGLQVGDQWIAEQVY